MEDQAAWARRISGGDRAEFERFLDAFGPRVHRLARRFAQSECDAEDLTQEIFVALFQSAGSFSGRSQLSTWVYRVALNHCLRHREKSRRQPPAQSQAPEVLESSASTSRGGADVRESTEAAQVLAGNDPAQQAARRELGAQVRGALGELSEGHRDVVVLHELHGMTYNQCAQLLNIPAGTVKSRLFHAMRHLRRHLEPYVLGHESAPASSSSSPTSASPTSASTSAARGETPC